MDTQIRFSKEPSTLLPAVPAKEYISQKLRASHPFFKNIPLRVQVFEWCVRKMVGALERLSGSTLFIKNPFAELFELDARARTLIARLKKQGIVYSFFQVGQTEDRPFILQYGVRFLEDNRMAFGRSRHLTAYGMGWSINDALRATLGEFFERHALARLDGVEFQRGSYEEFKKRSAVAPSVLSPFSLTQVKKKELQIFNVRDGDKISWVSAVSLHGESCLIPSSLVQLRFAPRSAKEKRIFPGSSNAAAAGSSYRDAVRRAILEGIERDSFFVYWLNKCTPQRIDPTSIVNKQVQRLLGELARYKLEVHFLNLTTDLDVPVVGTVLIDRCGGKSVSIGLAADFSPEKAAEKALRDVVRHSESTSVETEKIAPEAVCDLVIRRAFWAPQHMISEINFFLEGETVDVDTLSVKQPDLTIDEQYLELKTTLEQKKYNCYIADITTDMARREGVTVVKAVIPELIPMYFDEKLKPLGVRRIYDVPVSMGLRSRALREDELNNVPHPFL